ncbi:hypothetical protein GIB67_018411 [Kingdonia uniflora]|uniref:Uncharacterized protein n=1 Tax=Kingdonia uniflora TaxID=39325 RepID=A0A7J7MJL9_9MAGN|nr:hypothetical protein GIB67_018411 [Kingdonia uniflora]
MNEQVNEENQTQEGGAKKGTSNTKYYTSRCIGLGLHKMFAVLPKEEKGALHATCFVPLLLIDLIATMSTLVVEIFDRHLGDMKRYSLIKFVKNYAILSPPKQGEKCLGEINQIKAPAIGVVPTVGAPAVIAPGVGAPTTGSSSSATEIGAVVVRYQFSTPEKTMKHKQEEEITKTDIVFFNQEEVVGEAYQASVDQTIIASAEEQTLEVEKTKDEASQYIYLQSKESKEKVVESKDDDDGNSQNKPDPEQVIKEMAVDQTKLVLMESEVDVTLKKMHALTEDEINEKAFIMACRINQLHAHLDDLLPRVLL